MFESDSSSLKRSGGKGQETPGAFIGNSGNLYVRVRRVQPIEGDLYSQQTAVYPSIEAYNTRSGPPEYKQLSEVIDDYKAPVIIDLDTLTINFEQSHE